MLVKTIMCDTCNAKAEDGDHYLHGHVHLHQKGWDDILKIPEKHFCSIECARKAMSKELHYAATHNEHMNEIPCTDNIGLSVDGPDPSK
jgi:hypothetical protein